MPPCAASEGWRKTAGLPVLVSVAAAFCAMWPDLPTPTVTTLPRHPARSATARSTSAGASRAAVRATASASIRSSATTCS
jgi:hypothetical protein